MFFNLYDLLSDQFCSGMISRSLHATDEDPFDSKRLRFQIASADDFEFFSLNPFNGSIHVIAPLAAGHQRNVTVRVSDGSRSSSATLLVTVERIQPETLHNAVEIHLEGVTSPENYLSEKHRTFELTLKETLPPGFDPSNDLRIISLHQAGPSSIRLLIIIQKPTPDGGFYSSKAIRSLLLQSKDIISERLDVIVRDVIGTECKLTSSSCAGKCLSLIKLGNTSNELPVTSQTRSVLTPRFTRAPVCICPKGYVGNQCQPICDVIDDVCAPDEVCHVDATESSGYRCSKSNQRPEVIAFGGASIQRFVSTSQEIPFHVSFRFRTFQHNATLLRATGSSFAHLRIASRFLYFRFGCSGGISHVMTQSESRVDDGKWHDVIIESLTGSCAFRVVLDSRYEATSGSGQKQDVVFKELILGGVSDVTGAIVDGFIGCLEDFRLEDKLIRDLGKIQLVEEKKISDRCEIEISLCRHNPCLNGGLCEIDLERGDVRCECLDGFSGDKCEQKHVCEFDTCANGGVCLSQGHGFR